MTEQTIREAVKGLQGAGASLASDLEAARSAVERAKRSAARIMVGIDELSTRLDELEALGPPYLDVGGEDDAVPVDPPVGEDPPGSLRLGGAPDGLLVLSRDLDLMTRTVAGEARGEDYRGQVAVAAVILERFVTGYRAGPSTTSPVDGERVMSGTAGAVCLSPWQFSAWNQGDPNRIIALGLDPDRDSVYHACRMAVEDAITTDPEARAHVHHSRHYHATSIGFPAAWGEPKEPAVTIGRHAFYNDVP